MAWPGITARGRRIEGGRETERNRSREREGEEGRGETEHS